MSVSDTRFRFSAIWNPYAAGSFLRRNTSSSCYAEVEDYSSKLSPPQHSRSRMSTNASTALLVYSAILLDTTYCTVPPFVTHFCSRLSFSQIWRSFASVDARYSGVVGVLLEPPIVNINKIYNTFCTSSTSSS